MKSLIEAQFQNDFVEHFPGDLSGEKRSKQTPGVLYSRVDPTPVKDPKLLAWSEELAAEIGLARPTDQASLDILGGNNVLPSMKPYAACYAGHQFGNWAGQLGDGRAITLGELVAPDRRIWELQLKGAGQTPYSRRADGRAVLRSSVREYLMSEAMHHLGVPTTRALSLVSTGEKVMRDMFYDGHPEYEPGAIVMRVAPSFLRFGNFEMLAARKEIDQLKALTDWTIERFFPEITGEDRILKWFGEIVDRTAALMVEWMRLGFVHGVMNTDNMSILGLTIDYGPYGFVDDYDLNFTPNTTDLPGRRYAFGQQAGIAQWNLGCLAGAISLLLPDTEELLKILKDYRGRFMVRYHRMMAEKLGVDRPRKEDPELIQYVERVLSLVKPDMTIFYQLLIDLPTEQMDDHGIIEHFHLAFYTIPADDHRSMFIDMIQKLQERKKQNSITTEQAQQIMRRANPRIILRNYQLHEAIEDLQNGDPGKFNRLEQALKEPYSTKHDELFARRPEWAVSKAGCSMLSCSS